MAITRPVNRPVPFAGPGAKNAILNPSQSGGTASYTDGFPPATRTAIAAGGIPPSGLDMNGVLFDFSSHLVFLNAGGRYQFDATLATAIGGYPVGFVLQSNDGNNAYVNILAANSTDFNATPAAIGVSWIPYAGNANRQQPVLVTAGAANTLTAANAPPLVALPRSGFIQLLSITTANSGATTYAPDGLAAKPVYGLNNSALQGGELPVGGVATLMYVVSAAVNAGNGGWIVMECNGGASQVAPATASGHAVQFGQLTGLVGSVRNGRMYVSAASASATFTADQIIVATALNGLEYLLPSYSQTINLATTGAGGMDTGTAPVSGYVAIYAIYNPTTNTKGILATNAATLQGNVYGGANMPAGYTASALLAVVATNSSSQFLPVLVNDRRHSITVLTALTTGTVVANLTALAVPVPLNAKSVSGYTTVGVTGAGGTTGVLAGSATTTITGVGQQAVGTSYSGSGVTGVSNNIPFSPIDLTLAQTIYYNLSISATSGTLSINISSYWI